MNPNKLYEEPTKKSFAELGYASQEAMDTDLAMKKLQSITLYYSTVPNGEPFGDSRDSDVTDLEGAIQTLEQNINLLSGDERVRVAESVTEAKEQLALLRGSN